MAEPHGSDGHAEPNKERNAMHQHLRPHGGLHGPISDYVKTHCETCAAGWTRTGEDGAKVYVCLLDREPVWPQMSDCDRYEKREESEPETDT